VAEKHIKKYPHGVLHEPFEWRYESEEEYKKRTISLPNTSSDSSSESLGGIFVYFINRRRTDESNARFSQIVSELHKFYGTKESDWEALAQALIEHHVPAFTKGQPGRNKTLQEKHLKVLHAYNAAKLDLMAKGPAQSAKAFKLPQKTIHDLAGKTLGQSQSQYKESLREAKKWLNSEGSTWRPFLEQD
jgi:hypothetical protein